MAAGNMKESPTKRFRRYLLERASRANRAETLRILARAGRDNPPMEGDELPPDWKSETKNPSRKAARRPAKIRESSRKTKS
jgi:hypothetical protein